MYTLNTEATAQWIYADVIRYVKPYWNVNNVSNLSQLLHSKARKQGFCLNPSVEQHINHHLITLKKQHTFQEAS